ncbi:MAG: nucleotidyltransferase domain-containing protein [bacterium]
MKRMLKEIYSNRLKGVILYGSYARGDATDGSDIDLIILLEDMNEPIAELERCSKEIHRIDFEYDTLISIIPLDVNQYNTGKLPLILNAKREGILL